MAITIPSAGHRGIDTGSTFLSKMLAYQEALFLADFNGLGTTLTANESTVEAVWATLPSVPSFSILSSYASQYLLADNTGTYRSRQVVTALEYPDFDDSNWAEIGLPEYALGDISYSSYAKEPPHWLECNGALFDTSVYAPLATLLSANVRGVRLSTSGSVTTSGVAFRGDSAYIATSTGTAPYYTLNAINNGVIGGSYTVDTAPTGIANGIAFGSQGLQNYLAIAHATTPFVSMYLQTASGVKQANPATLPTGTGNDVAFSGNGGYLAVAHATSPFLSIYTNSGGTLTKVANPATLPLADGKGVSFSSDGVYLAVATASTTEPLVVYKQSAGVFTKLTLPTINGMNGGQSCSFSSDGVYLAVTGTSSNTLVVLKRSGDTFTIIATGLESTISYSVSFSPNGQFLLVGQTAEIKMYKNVADVISLVNLQPNPFALGGTIIGGVGWSSDNLYFGVGNNVSPYLNVYKNAPVTPNITRPDTEQQVIPYINTGI